MLTAFSGTGDVVDTTLTFTSKGVVVAAFQRWDWPASPAPGQQARSRNTVSNRAARGKPLTLAEDNGLVYTAAASDQAINVHGTATVVCYRDTGKRRCGYGNIDTTPGTYSVRTGRWLNPNFGSGLLSPGTLAHEIAKGQWKVLRRTWLAGQRALELKEGSPGVFDPLPTLLWISARSFLPLRMINGVGQPTQDATYWHYLKPTQRHLALLRVPIPPGYPRSGQAKG